MKFISKITDKNFSKFNDLYVKLFDVLGMTEKNAKILLAVSGGPDSMFLAVLIYNLFVEYKLDLNNLFFVHCNHKTRNETDNEQKFVEDFFAGLNLSVCVYPLQGQSKKTEKNLREWRYGEFQKIIDKNNIDFLLTGHNLTDRIESSFMNMLRGAGLNGFRSMRFVDQNNLLSQTKIVRPLLGYTKAEIEGFCRQYDIGFVVDSTNFDKDISLRNKIRLGLFPQFAVLSNKSDSYTNSFLESMKQIYADLDALQGVDDIGTFVKIRQSGYWNSDFAFLRDIPLGFISQGVLLKVFKKFNISSGISTDALSNYVSFFRAARQGYKNINGVYFFLSHGKIYIIKAKENFWKKYVEKTIIIDKLGSIELGKELVDINDKKLIGLKLRYPKKGDKLGSKSWSKYCINHKIPVFWRNFVPVVVSENIIVDCFKGVMYE